MNKIKVQTARKTKGRAIYEQVAFVAKFCNKHGRLKENKMSGKELRKARAACTHHQYTKDGHPKNRVTDNMDNTVTCRICGARFTMLIWEPKKLKKVAKQLQEQADVLKWCLAGIGDTCHDQKTMDYLMELHYNLGIFHKISKRIQKMFQKTKAAKRKKNKDNFNVNKSGSSYGSWSNR